MLATLLKRIRKKEEMAHWKKVITDNFKDLEHHRK